MTLQVVLLKNAAMAKKIDERFLDKRVAARYVHEGEISQSDWDAHLADLPDDAGKSEAISPAKLATDDVGNDDGDSTDDAAESSPADANGSGPLN